jgi:hypothetical protein
MKGSYLCAFPLLENEKEMIESVADDFWGKHVEEQRCAVPLIPLSDSIQLNIKYTILVALAWLLFQAAMAFSGIPTSD